MLYVSIGHGVRPNGTFDPGAVHTATGVTEYDGNRELAGMVTGALRAAGLSVESESDMAPGTDPDYQGSVELVNRAGRPLAIDFHQDWEQGSSALCWPLVHPDGTESQRIAGEIISSCVGAGLSVKGPTARSDLWWLNGTACPAILIEAGRVGTPRPVADLAAAIADGICRALGFGPILGDGQHPPAETPGAPPGDATVPPAGEAPAWPGVYLVDRTADPSALAWQAQMVKRGWAIDTDGVYGPQSADVCLSFQLEKGFTPDSCVGPETWAASWSLPVTP
jgi:hypothetical protein